MASIDRHGLKNDSNSVSISSKNFHDFYRMNDSSGLEPQANSYARSQINRESGGLN